MEPNAICIILGDLRKLLTARVCLVRTALCGLYFSEESRYKDLVYSFRKPTLLSREQEVKEFYKTILEVMKKDGKHVHTPTTSSSQSCNNDGSYGQVVIISEMKTEVNFTKQSCRVAGCSGC